MFYDENMEEILHDEMLDIIDENDIVTDTKERNEIHQKGLLHREIHVWFFDTAGNIFFQKRGVEKASGGLLDASVGGHVDAGENYTEAAIRETQEEIGLLISSSDLFLIKKFRATSKDAEKNRINNFSRSVYIHTLPIIESQIVKEAGVIGVDFEKFSCEHLLNLSKKEIDRFDQYILTDEIPFVIEYIKNL